MSVNTSTDKVFTSKKADTYLKNGDICILAWGSSAVTILGENKDDSSLYDISFEGQGVVKRIDTTYAISRGDRIYGVSQGTSQTTDIQAIKGTDGSVARNIGFATADCEIGDTDVHIIFGALI